MPEVLTVRFDKKKDWSVIYTDQDSYAYANKLFFKYKEGQYLKTTETFNIFDEPEVNNEKYEKINKGSIVCVKKIGKDSSIEGIENNWVLLELQSVDDKGNYIPAGKTGYYLGYDLNPLN